MDLLIRDPETSKTIEIQEDPFLSDSVYSYQVIPEMVKSNKDNQFIWPEVQRSGFPSSHSIITSHINTGISLSFDIDEQEMPSTKMISQNLTDHTSVDEYDFNDTVETDMDFKMPPIDSFYVKIKIVETIEGKPSPFDPDEYYYLDCFDGERIYD